MKQLRLSGFFAKISHFLPQYLDNEEFLPQCYNVTLEISGTGHLHAYFESGKGFIQN